MNEDLATKVTLRLPEEQIARLPEGATNTERLRAAVEEWLEDLDARERTESRELRPAGVDDASLEGASLARIEELLLEILTNGVLTMGSALRAEAAAKVAADLVEGGGTGEPSDLFEAESERLHLELYDQMAGRADRICDAVEASRSTKSPAEPAKSAAVPIETAAE